MKKFFSRKVLISALAALVILSLYLRSQIDSDFHTYPFDEKIALKRLDYFSHYQLIGPDEELLLDYVNKVGIQDSILLFFSQEGDALRYNKRSQALDNLPSDLIPDYSSVETYNPWSLTDQMNDEDNFRLALKLCYFAMIIILASLLVSWIRKKL